MERVTYINLLYPNLTTKVTSEVETISTLTAGGRATTPTYLESVELRMYDLGRVYAILILEGRRYIDLGKVTLC